MHGPIIRGSPPPPEARVTLDNWDSPPFNRWSFCHIREVLPTVQVHRGTGPRSVLPEDLRPLGGTRFKAADGAETTIDQWLETDFADGLIVLHHGRVAYERYLNGMTPRTLHLSQSVAKSFVCILAGILAGDGTVDLDEPVETFIPELRGTGYAGATLRQVMDMQSGVEFVEDYTDPDCDVAVIDRIAGWKPRRPDDPETMIKLMAGLAKARPHGVRWEYRSIETDVAAHCLERATEERLADLVSARIWDPLGVDEDGSFTVDRNGYALGDGGFNATLRDYARFGEMLTRGGHFNGQQVVPEIFVNECRTGDATKFSGPATTVLPNGAYRNGFWIEDASTGVIMCRGVFGQLIYSDAANALTVARLATWPEALSDVRGINSLRAIHAMRDALLRGA